MIEALGLDDSSESESDAEHENASEAVSPSVCDYNAVMLPRGKWKRPTQLTSISDPRKVQILSSATLAAEFLKVPQSKVSGARNTKEVVNGWFA